MDIDEPPLSIDIEEVVESLQSELAYDEIKAVEGGRSTELISTPNVVPWNWIFWNLLQLLHQYPSGITRPIVLNELQLLWDETAADWRRALQRKTESIDSIYENRVIPTLGILDVIIDSTFLLPSTTATSSSPSGVVVAFKEETGDKLIDWFPEQRFVHLITGDAELKLPPLLKPGRKMRLTRCRLQDYYGKKEVNRLRMIPTEFAVILLDKADPDDYQFFTSRFLEPVGDFSNIDTSDFGQNAYLRGKIMKNRTVKLSQGSLTPSLSLSQSYETTRHQRRVFVQGRHGAQFRIVLGQEESSLSLLFREGDHIALARPYIGTTKPDPNGVVTVNYGPESVLFVLFEEKPPEFVPYLSRSTQEATPTQVRVPMDENGNKDYSHFPGRMGCGDVRSLMTNFSLFGRVEYVTSNTPVSNASMYSERFGLKLSDVASPTKSVQITRWGYVGTSSSFIREGQLVYLYNLESAKSKQATAIYVNASSSLPTQIVVPSQMEGFLASTFMYRVVNIADATQRQLNNFVIKATAVPKFADEKKTVFMHSVCKRSTLVHKATGQNIVGVTCSFCGTAVPESEQDLYVSPHRNFNVYWNVRDVNPNRGNLSAEGLYLVNRELFGVSAPEFHKLSRATQNEVITLKSRSSYRKTYLMIPNQGSQPPKFPFLIEQVLECD